MKNDNTKKLFFKYYDKNNILSNLMKNDLFKNNYQSINKINTNIFPSIYSVLKNY